MFDRHLRRKREWKRKKQDVLWAVSYCWSCSCDLVQILSWWKWGGSQPLTSSLQDRTNRRNRCHKKLKVGFAWIALNGWHHDRTRILTEVSHELREAQRPRNSLSFRHCEMTTRFNVTSQAWENVCTFVLLNATSSIILLSLELGKEDKENEGITKLHSSLHLTGEGKGA